VLHAAGAEECAALCVEQVRNGRQGVYFKERMRRGETIVSFPRNLRLDEKTAMKGKAGHIFQRLKADKCYPDLMVSPPRTARILPTLS